MQQGWRRLNGRKLVRPIEDELEDCLLEEQLQGHAVRICIGTDSQVKGGEIHFATVVVLLRKGSGGYMFIQTEVVRRPMAVRQRMLEEVSRSIGVAYALCGLLNRYGVRMEVHADINTDPAYKSHDALAETMGYIRGMGFEFRAKPQAFASSSCANKIVQ